MKFTIVKSFISDLRSATVVLAYMVQEGLPPSEALVKAVFVVMMVKMVVVTMMRMIIDD